MITAQGLPIVFHPVEKEKASSHALGIILGVANAAGIRSCILFAGMATVGIRSRQVFADTHAGGIPVC